MKQIKTITPENFEPYGYVLCYDDSERRQFQIRVTEPNTTGWRMAVKKVSHKRFSSLQRHPDSMESFSPVSGVSIIIVAEPDSPKNYELFLLDKSVCLEKNIWHSTICLSDCAFMEVTENFEVGMENYELGKVIGVFADECQPL